MADPSHIVETLKAKAMLLIQREREVLALRLGRDQVRSWLEAFHNLSVRARPEAGASMCADWTTAMIEERSFQTAAAFRYDARSGILSLVHGQSHSAIAETIALEDGARRVLGAHSQGLFHGGADPDRTALAQGLGLQAFMWFLFPNGDGTEMLLVAGVALGVGGAQGAVSGDDLVYFVMLGRHLAVLLSNASLISALGSAKRNLQELFDHMRQAIVAFDGSGRVTGVSSRQAKVIFDRDDLEGCSVRELLYPHAPSYDVAAASFDEWAKMVLGAPVAEWEWCTRYAPREAVVTMRDGTAVPIELEFRPLVRDAAISHVMLLASDVSAARELEKAVHAHEADQSRRVATMRRLIAGGTQVFLSFVDTARKRLTRCEVVLSDHPGALPTERVDELFRHVHTVRGEARAFDLLELEAVTKGLEETLDGLRSVARGVSEVPAESISVALGVGLREAQAALDRGCEVLVAASPAGAAVFDQAIVQRSALRELVELTRHRCDPVAHWVGRLTSVPLGVAAASVVESTPAWAAAQGNLVTIRVEPRELMIPDALAQVLPGVLTHLVRNAIAHGIEPPEVRGAAGKPEHGSIHILAENGPRGVRIMVTDDGRGLDVDGIIARGDPDVDVTEAVFLPGVTTRAVPDALAGRGVGLDAVRKELAGAGFEVSVDFAPEQWTRFAIEPEAQAKPMEGQLKIGGPWSR